MFVSESFYRQAVDLYWKRPVPFDVTKQGTPIFEAFVYWHNAIQQAHFRAAKFPKFNNIDLLYDF